MNTDRFKFRVWDCDAGSYRYDLLLLEMDGTLCDDSFEPIQTYDPNRFIIEQCTGQKDKNGNLIYEGDIVSVYDPITDEQNKCYISWTNETTGYVCLYLHKEKIVCGCGLASAYLNGAYRYCEIIGNIHETI